MAKHELLNNITHKNLRVITRHGAEFGENVGTVLTVPTEYGDIQREYPIFFRRDAQGEFLSVALLGFSKDENLFLEGDRWDASYVPGILARGPFLIGFQEREEGGDIRREPVIHIDLDSPRVSETEGEPVFLELGGNSRYLEKVKTILGGINEGLLASKAMFAAFNALDLIEPIKVEIKLSEDERYDVVGLHTINEQKLRALDDASIVKLHRSGFLQGAYLVLASHNNLRHLIERKQRRRRAEIEKQAASPQADTAS
jgi:hypothetical protein